MDDNKRDIDIQNIQELEDQLKQHANNPAVSGTVKNLSEKIEKLRAKAGTADFANEFADVNYDVNHFEDQQKAAQDFTAASTYSLNGLNSSEPTENNSDNQDDYHFGENDRYEEEVSQTDETSRPKRSYKKQLKRIINEIGKAINGNTEGPDLSKKIRVASTRITACKGNLDKNNAFTMQEFEKAYSSKEKAANFQKNVDRFWVLGGIMAAGKILSTNTTGALNTVGALTFAVAGVLAGYHGITKTAKFLLQNISNAIGLYKIGLFDANKSLLRRVEKKSAKANKAEYIPGEAVPNNWPAKIEWDKKKSNNQAQNPIQQSDSGPDLRNVQGGEQRPVSVIYGNNIKDTIEKEKQTYIKNLGNLNKIGARAILYTVGAAAIYYGAKLAMSWVGQPTQVDPETYMNSVTKAFIFDLAPTLIAGVGGILLFKNRENIMKSLTQPKTGSLDALDKAVNELEKGKRPDLLKERDEKESRSRAEKIKDFAKSFLPSLAHSKNKKEDALQVIGNALSTPEEREAYKNKNSLKP